MNTDWVNLGVPVGSQNQQQQGIHKATQSSFHGHGDDIWEGDGLLLEAELKLLLRTDHRLTS